MKDKPQDIGTDSKSLREKDVIDYNHELSGTDNRGRIKRFSVDPLTLINPDEREKRKTREQRFVSMLVYMLENDAQYQELYFNVEAKLEEAQNEVENALQKISHELNDIRNQLEHAAHLGLSEEQLIELRRKQEELERHRQEILDYQRDVLKPIRQRMDDEDNPPSKEELDEFQERIRDKRPEYLAELSASENAPMSVSSGIDGKLSFNSPDLCDTFCTAHDNKVILPNDESNAPNFEPIKLG